MVDLRRLSHFVAVAEQHSINAAAQQCGISQAGLTKSIRTLEGGLQTILFQRSPRGVELTRAGAVFLRHARLILSQSEAAAAALAHESSGAGARLRLGVSSSWIVQAIMPQVLNTALNDARRPHINIVTNLSSQEMIEELRNGALDVVVAAPNTLDNLEEVDVRPISQFRQGLIVRSGHRLSDLVAPVTFEDLAYVEWICGPPGSYFRSCLDSLHLTNERRAPDPRFVTTSHDLTLDIVAQSDLVGIAIDKVVSIRHTNRVIMLDSIFSLDRWVSVLSRKGDILPMAAEDLIESLSVHFADARS
ncbi:LysR family transcriptional regulator [Chelativorans sp. AA-79]|uniref:LysR family transcriptional regulator n=1 Tax=Chelativorans sp. AA-79 TaxID=3028735 RepID=UPI0023F92D3C|nr:LysR family transcriptional regulator [Chelativorans sp. AA-79]WEX12162.1 LysR family transcriptional regulator [Chelativorans sp. AA-79]